MIHVIVKGTRSQAAQAATNRSLPMTFVTETRLDETVATIEDQFYDQVVSWFIEDIRAEPGKGFPVGSLLSYNQTKVDDDSAAKQLARFIGEKIT